MSTPGSSSSSPSGSGRFNPFPGLRPFSTDEDYLFFGRENQIAELLSLLRRQRFLAVVGTSGSGKSSIVRAGLLPELLGGGMSGAGSAWEAVTMRPGGDPLHALAKAFCEAGLYDGEDPDTIPQLLATLNRSGSGLIEAARQSDLGEGTNLLVLVDQFEEVFRLQRSGVAKQDEARSFVRLLLEASSQQEVPIFIVLTMRSDYLGDCALFSGLAEAVNEGEYLIPRFSRDQLQAAIEGPVRVGGGTIAFRLLQRLLNDVGDQQDQLPVLQHALMRTWDRWENDHADEEPIDLRHYDAVGTMSEALSVHADEVFASLASDEHRQLASRIFKALTEKGSDNRGIRRPLRLHTLAAIAGADPEAIIPILDAYRAPGVTFLMPGEETELADQTVIDISHESLMRVWQRLRTWVEDEAQSARIYRRLADTAQLWEDGRAGLYHDPDLQIAQSWREETAPTEAWARLYGGGFETAMRFLDASHEAELRQEREKEAARQRELEQAKALAEAEGLRVAEQEKGARRLRRLLAVAAAIAVVAVGASIFAARQTRKAKTSEEASDALAAELKATLVQGDWELSYAKLDAGDGGASLAFLGRAMRNDPSFAPAGMRAVSTLVNGSIPTRRFAPIEHDKPINELLHNEKHDVLVTSSDGGRDVRLWDFETRAPIAVLEARNAPRSGLVDDAPVDPAFVARITEDFAGARRIWLATDPPNPPPDPRFFRKTIAIPPGRTPVRADLFVEVDDAFELMVNGSPAGRGEVYNTTFHVGLRSAALTDGLDLRITARNHTGNVGLVAAVFVTFEHGDPLVVTSDATWQSSADPEEGFARSREYPRRDYSGKVLADATRAPIKDLAWSADGDRVLGLSSGTPLLSTDDGPSTIIRFVNRTPDPVSLFWLDREGIRKPYGAIPPGGEQTQGTAVGHVFLVLDKDDQPILIVQATAQPRDAVIEGNAGPIDFAMGSTITAWGLATGEPAGALLAVPGDVTSIQVAPLNGPEDLVGCEFGSDGALQVWNVTVGRAETPRLTTGGKAVRWRFSPDGRRIIGLFSDSLIGIWETVGGAEVARFDTRPIFADGLHVSGDGRFVAATDNGNRNVVWWEIASGPTAEAPWVEVPFGFGQTHFHPAGDLISVTGFEGERSQGVVRARTWSLADRREVADISSDPQAVPMGMVGGDFAILGVVNGNVVTIWDLATGEILQRLVAPELLESANLSPDGRRVIAGSATSGTSAVAGSAEKKLFVFDLFAGRIAIPKPIVLGGPSRIAFSPDAETLVTIDPSENAVRFWDLRTGRQVREPVLHSSIQGPRPVTFSRSGSRVALWQMASVAYGEQSIGQRTGRVFIEQVGAPPALPEFLAEHGIGGGWVHAPSDGGRWMTWSRRPGDEVAQLVIRDRRSLEVIRTLDFEVPEWVPSTLPVVWSRDGGRMVFVKGRNAAAVADTTTGEILAEISHEGSVFGGVAISPDGSRAAIGCADGLVKTWSAEGGQTTIDPFPEEDRIRVIEFNEDGSLLGIADRTRATFAVVDGRTGEPRIPATQGELPAEDFAFTRDGRFVIVASAGSSGRNPMFDLATGERVREFELRDWTRGLDLSPDGRVLASGSGSNLSAVNGVAYLFEVATGRQLTPPLSAGGSVMEVAFDPRGAVVATGTHLTATGFGYAQLWDVATGRPLTDPIPGRGHVAALTFATDGDALAVGWSNGVVNLVPVPPRAAIPDWLPDLAEAVGDRRLAPDTGVLESVGGDRLARLRDGLMAGDEGSVAAPDDPWAPWARWLFENPQERAISPGAATTMARHLARLRAGADIFDLHQAVRWAPGDALSHARLAILYQQVTPDNLPAPARRHWDDAAIWFSDRAIALAADDVEVWTMRADLMRRLNRSDAAAEATARVLALAPADGGSDSPNVLYQNALALAAESKWDEAVEAFGGALSLLDDYRVQLDAGEQPLPLLGVLSRLVPTRKASENRVGGGGDGAVGWSKEPIAGAFEDFEGIVGGQLPEGWRTWNRTDGADRPGVHHLGGSETDLWKDWVVVRRDQLEAAVGQLPRRILREYARQVADGEALPLLDAGFALALSQGRSGNQVQFLESPDFDCTGQTGVHLAFHSAWEAHARAMGIVEYSVDGGEHWLPARFFIDKGFLDEARTGGPDDAELDLEKLLDTPRDQFPWWIGEGGKLAGGSYGAFVNVPRDHPRLADRFEGRPPSTDSNRLEFKKVEGIPLPEADGKPAVRVRFGLVASNALYWAIDEVGLYPGAETKAEPEGGAEPSPEMIALERPAADPSALAKLAMETAFGREAGVGDWSQVAGQVAEAGNAAASAAEAPVDLPGGSASDSSRDQGENVIQARLLVMQALSLEGGRDTIVRASAAAVLLRCLQVDEAWNVLVTSDDRAADLASSEWRNAMALAAFLRGTLAAAFGSREVAYALLTVADQLSDSSDGGPSQAVREALAGLETPEEAAARPQDVVLVQRGSAWSYFDEGRLPADDWMMPEFDDSRWFRGRAPLGGGDPGMVTTVQLGPDAARFPTTYFRASFAVADMANTGSLVLRVRRDDGVVVYLNGSEVARNGMPAGPVGYDTFANSTASDDDETRFFTIPVDAAPLREGTNWLAVEVHQVNARSSDLVFDLELVSSPGTLERAALAVPVPVMAERLEALEVPGELRGELLRRLVETFADDGDVDGLRDGLKVVEAAYGAADAAVTSGAAELPRLQALAAEAEGDAATADRLYAQALQTIFARVDAGEPLDHRALPPALREAALLVRRGPADGAFLYQRCRWRWQNVPEIEKELVLRWARQAVGEDSDGLAVLCRALREENRHDEVLAIADTVLASLQEPAAGALPREILRHKDWLRTREAALRALGRDALADAVLDHLAAAPQRDPALGPECIDLSAHYNASLFDSRRWHASDSGNNLWRLIEAYEAETVGVSYDIRGLIYLNSGVFPESFVVSNKTVAEHYNLELPDAVEGIRIGRSAKVMRFMVSALHLREPEGGEVAHFLVHHADGSESRIPIRAITDVGDWFRARGNNLLPASKENVVRSMDSSETGFVLQQLTWENPKPGVAIDSLDFVSAKAKAAPFVVAITVEE